MRERDILDCVSVCDADYLSLLLIWFPLCTLNVVVPADWLPRKKKQKQKVGIVLFLNLILIRKIPARLKSKMPKHLFFFATWALQPNSSYGWDCILFIFIYKKKSNKKKFSLNEIQQDSYTIKGTFDNCNISIEIRLSHLALYSLQLLSSFKNERFQLFSFHISDLWMLAKPIDNYDVLCGCVRESRRFKASALRHQVFRYALLFRLSKINFTKGWNGAKTASLLFIPRTRGVLSLSIPFFFLPATRRATKQSCWRRKMSFQMIQTVCDVCQIWSCQKKKEKGDPFTRSKLSFAFFPSFQRLAECERRESPRQWEKKD